MYRLAIIDNERCKPTKCKQECRKKCPVNSQGYQCIDIEDLHKAKIAENLCIGCGICEKVCPFNAIKIVRLPTELESDLVHSYGENTFRLYRIPIIRPGQIMGILGQNGIGKSTLIQILSGKIIPTLNLKGTEMFKYFNNLHKGKYTIATKPQTLPTVNEAIDRYETMSGGQKQMAMCATVVNSEADVYIFDEPSNFLDLKQRIIVSRMILGLKSHGKFVIVIDHDIGVLEYIADYLTLLYGEPGCYGIVSKPYSCNEGINNYFDGYLPAENVRFRKDKFSYSNKSELTDCDLENHNLMAPYPKTTFKYPTVDVTVDGGNYYMNYGVTLILGENGTGKTSFIKLLSENLGMSLAIKPQHPGVPKKYRNVTVETFLLNHARNAMCEGSFRSDIIKTLHLDRIMNKHLGDLSGGEQQVFAIAYCLSKDVPLYLLDEPCAALDIEQRVNLVRALKRYICNTGKSIFLIEHDLNMALSLCKDLHSQVIFFESEPNPELGQIVHAKSPERLSIGMNRFLKSMNITLRQSQHNNRQSINKCGSVKDKEQKSLDCYYID